MLHVIIMLPPRVTKTRF